MSKEAQYQSLVLELKLVKSRLDEAKSVCEEGKQDLRFRIVEAEQFIAQKQREAYRSKFFPKVNTGGSSSGPERAKQDDTGTNTAKAKVSDHTLYYVEPTWMIGERFGVFLKGGAAEVTVSSQETMATNSTYGDQDVWGVLTGYGAKFYMGNFFVKAEYTETEYGKIMLKSTTGNKNIIEANIDSEKTGIAIGYNF